MKIGILQKSLDGGVQHTYDGDIERCRPQFVTSRSGKVLFSDGNSCDIGVSNEI